MLSRAGSAWSITMFLKRVDIEQFRGIQKLSVNLDQTTVLIGENNTGKSTIMAALHLVLGSFPIHEKGKFTEYDHHLATKDSYVVDSSPIEIVLHFSERHNNEWPAQITQKLNEVIQYDKAGNQNVIVRVRVKYDSTTNESILEWEFLNMKMQRLIINSLFYYRKTLRSLTPVFSLQSTRDSHKEFRSGSASFWNPFVRSVVMDADLRQELEDELAGLNQKIIDAHEPFSVIGKQLRNIAKLVPMVGANPANIETLPSSVHDVLARTRVFLSSDNGARIPVTKHGDGIQNLAIICLFIAFLQNKLKERSELASPILTLEEPEAHLHPSAAYSVIDLLQNPSGQNIIATHSGDLVSNAPVSSLRRLRRKNGSVVVHQVNWEKFDPKDKITIDYYIRTTRGNILFARCWLLVEGKTDRLVFERCAQLCGLDLTHEGVYCVEYSQLRGPKTLIRFAKQLGIEWFVVADGDQSGNGYVQQAEAELQGQNKEAHIYQLEHIMDVVLCLNGYGHHYEKADSVRFLNQTQIKNAVYWSAVVKSRKSKTASAMSAVDEMCESGKYSIPAVIRQLITRSINLAKEA